MFQTLKPYAINFVIVTVGVLAALKIKEMIDKSSIAAPMSAPATS